MKQKLLYFLVLCLYGQLGAQTIFSKVYGPGGTKQSEAQVTAIAPDSGYFMSGGKGDPNSPGDALLIRVNKNGDTLWTAGFGTTMGDGLIGVVPSGGGGCGVVETENMGFAQKQATPRMIFARFNAAGQQLYA